MSAPSSLPDAVFRESAGPADFDAILRVRRAVFVDEQGGPLDEEPDPWDPGARHFLVEADGQVVGTARLYEPAPGTGKIGRVALLPEYRGRGWGGALFALVLGAAWADRRFRELVLDAQTHATSFYERFGFRPEGEVFLDAGLPHRRMRLSLAPPDPPAGAPPAEADLNP